MKAREVMTREVATVAPDTATGEIARLLLERRISAVPVVDAGGAPIGMVSEGDLIGRDAAARASRRDWWLALLAEGTELSENFINSLRRPERTARDVMSAPVVTIEEDTEAGEIARLLAEYRIKRVPVIHDGKLVGIVSRADLLRALAGEQAETRPAAAGVPAHGLLGGLSDWVGQVEEHFRHDRGAAAPPPPRPAAPAGGVSADDFRGLVQDFARREAEHQDETRRAAAQQRRQRAEELIDRHVSDESWRALLHQARQAAEHGRGEWLLLRFPSQLLSDGGRAVNVPLPDWPNTLRGEAAELYLRWERELKPQGFGLAARILDFPDGMPGDVGLFLVWGE
jgi:CBS domain-containing protein